MKRQPRNPKTDKLVNERLISMAYGQIGEHPADRKRVKGPRSQDHHAGAVRGGLKSSSMAARRRLRLRLPFWVLDAGPSTGAACITSRGLCLGYAVSITDLARGVGFEEVTWV